MADLTAGWARACSRAGCSWGGGETQTITGIIELYAINLAGAAVRGHQAQGEPAPGEPRRSGRCNAHRPRHRASRQRGNLARKIAGELPRGYATEVPGDPRGRGIRRSAARRNAALRALGRGAAKCGHRSALRGARHWAWVAQADARHRRAHLRRRSGPAGESRISSCSKRGRASPTRALTAPSTWGRASRCIYRPAAPPKRYASRRAQVSSCSTRATSKQDRSGS